MSGVRTLAGWEFRNAVRTRWVLGGGIAFAFASVGVVMIGMHSTAELGLTGVGPAATSLLGLAMLLPPLIGLLLGAGAIAGGRERGTLQMILVQPGGRRSYVLGAFLGLAASIWVILAAGLAASALLLGAVAELNDIRSLLAVAAATFGAATASVAIGMLVSSYCATRAQATAWCVVLWFFFGVGADLILVSLVPALNIGPAGVLATITLNPVESARTLALLIMDPELSALGPFGAFMTWEVGVVGAIAILVGTLLAWCGGTLAAAHQIVRRIEL
ncbi:MAG: ABC transporter permease subunit [Actinobacteria bacterium]|jgi:ABC-type transport system involved in multi-copper enzyme maturation permease subunit|nr:ABC transporter permease subunit [Actinomycetota bacterium]